MAAKVFISYRRDDSAGHAGRVRDRLERELGRNLLFMDVDAIPLGTNFSKVLHEEVAKCGVLLAVIGPNWPDARDGEGKRRLDDPNDFVHIEVAAALHRDIPVIPILLDGSRIPKASELPDDLRELAFRNGLDVRHASFHQDMDRLISALKKQLGQAGGPKRVDLVEENVSELIGETARGTQSHIRTLQGGNEFWRFLRDKRNQQVLGWLGGGLVVAVTGLWVAFVYFFPPDKKPTASTTTVITQSGPGIASGRDTVINAPVNIGLDEKKVGQRHCRRTKAFGRQTGNHLAARTAREKGVEIAPLRATLVKLGEAGVSDEDIPKRLDGKADELIKLREEIAQLRRGPQELASFAQQAQALIDKGDFEGAQAALASGRTAARALREQASQYEANFAAQEARVYHLQLAYRSAATKYAEAASLIASVDPQQQWWFVLAQASELVSQGDEFGDNPALVEAIDANRKALSLAPRSQRWSDWATTQNNLGIALLRLGERESGTAKLEEAVTAFREALKERTRERVPLEWAGTQNNLGTALAVLGERESGTAKLEEAVTAYREALKEQTRERVPLDWAGTQNNLGIALLRLGERESGTAKLEEAVTAFREALKERTRERVPLEWAGTQNNLGTALGVLGERESGAAKLEEAVTAYREALKEQTRERMPLQWAITQNNLGNALQLLGGRESGTAKLEEAVIAYREALMEQTRERAPLEWARCFGNEGVALMLLAERRGDATMAETALSQINAASQTLRDGGHARNAAYYEDELPRARALVARLRGG